MSKHVSIFGAGAWGTAIAQILAKNGHQVTLWSHNHTVAQEINAKHTNQTYAQGISLHKNIVATTVIADAMQQPDWLVEAIPVTHLRGIFTKIQAASAGKQTPWLLLSKGIEQQTNLLPSGILMDVFGRDIPTVVLAGPTFAKELVAEKFTAAMLAGSDLALVDEAVQMASTPYFKLYPSNDLLGVQVAGAIKNVIALAAGLAAGIGGGENMHAFILTKGFAELVTLINFYGGQVASSTSLAGLGDLVLTASSILSKNYRAGMFLAKGATLAEASKEIGTQPEGLNTLQSLNLLSKTHNVPLPLCDLVYGAIFKGESFFAQLRSL
jgi:glycerol-3-phosphate dehydrogenase (NAD(P)+)